MEASGKKNLRMLRYSSVAKVPSDTTNASPVKIETFSLSNYLCDLHSMVL
jgi:hypothetical protein